MGHPAHSKLNLHDGFAHRNHAWLSGVVPSQKTWRNLRSLCCLITTTRDSSSPPGHPFLPKQKDSTSTTDATPNAQESEVPSQAYSLKQRLQNSNTSSSHGATKHARRRRSSAGTLGKQVNQKRVVNGIKARPPKPLHELENERHGNVNMAADCPSVAHERGGGDEEKPEASAGSGLLDWEIIDVVSRRRIWRPACLLRRNFEVEIHELAVAVAADDDSRSAR